MVLLVIILVMKNCEECHVVIHLYWYDIYLCFSDIDDATVAIKTKELLQDYGRFMDDQKKGLNNYAKPILTLVGKSKNGKVCAVLPLWETGT